MMEEEKEMTRSLKTNPTYKALAVRAINNAAPKIASGDYAAAARAATDIHRGATPCKLKTMRFSPQQVALRYLRLRFVRSFPVYGGVNATYVAGHARVYAHKSGWEGRV
jgi:hypothetical protein